MPRYPTLEQLRAQETAEKTKLAEQKKVLKAVQRKRHTVEQRLRLERWRAMGQMAEKAGLGTLETEMLQAAFEHLATLAQDPIQRAHWRQQMQARNVAVQAT
jgi:hypothetical protein